MSSPGRNATSTKKQPVQMDRLFCIRLIERSALGELGKQPKRRLRRMKRGCFKAAAPFAGRVLPANGNAATRARPGGQP